MARGTFGIIHPGHLNYLRERAKLGDELYVVFQRDSRMSERKDLVMDEEERRQVVDTRKIVDVTVLGSERAILNTVDMSYQISFHRENNQCGQLNMMASLKRL